MIIVIVALLVASPALLRLIVYPRTEFFTELWLLGPNHKAEDYPFTITRGQNYTVFLDIANHLGYTAYYLVEVKFRNSTQPAPIGSGLPPVYAPSSVPSLYNFSIFVADEGVSELPLIFSFDYANSTLSTLQMHGLALNGVPLNIANCSISWNGQSKVFGGYLFFEAWIYNNNLSGFNYHDRFVSLSLNMTI